MAKLGDCLMCAYAGRRCMRAIRKNGVLVKARSVVGHTLAGYVKTGLTPREVEALWVAKGWRVELALGVTHRMDVAIVTAEQASRRLAAAKRRRLLADQRAASEPPRPNTPDEPLSYMTKVINRNLLKYACGRAMFCPGCNAILDVDRAGFRADGVTVACLDCLSRSNSRLGVSPMEVDGPQQGKLSLD